MYFYFWCFKRVKTRRFRLLFLSIVHKPLLADTNTSSPATSDGHFREWSYNPAPQDSPVAQKIPILLGSKKIQDQKNPKAPSGRDVSSSSKASSARMRVFLKKHFFTLQLKTKPCLCTQTVFYNTHPAACQAMTSTRQVRRW